MGVGRILCMPPKLLERCRDASVSSSIRDCVRYLSRSNMSRDIALGGTTVEPGKASASSALSSADLPFGLEECLEDWC